ELEAWTPDFIFEKEGELSSDDESEGDIENAIRDDKETECDHVSETSFAQDHDADFQEVLNCNGHSINSDGPFEIYKILKRKKDTPAVNGDNQPNDNSEANGDNQPTVSAGNYSQHTPQFPPGFTPDVEKNVAGSGKPQSSYTDSQEDALWGNLSFDYAFSPSIGFSGGILCVWDPRLFVKDYSTISDFLLAFQYVIPLYQILIISIYAPQDLNERKMLWEFFRHLIDSWDGEYVLLSDFNEVRYEHERHGSFFNPHGANSFNNFITSTGLIDLPFEGYSFTLSHKSASKMSKLDRFLILEGLLARFPYISALCLNKHLLDHRPILLYELKVDYGPTLFLFFSRGPLKVYDELSSERTTIYKELNDLIRASSLVPLSKREKIHDVAGTIGSFPPGCNSSFLALISKTQEAKLVNDFRPISLIDSLYKIITKVLARRMSHVIPTLVSDVQSAFVSNRQILDGPFILNELLSWCKDKKSKALIFKIDFEKAFDYVRWDYLDTVLSNFGFEAKWRSWIQGCLKSAMGSILVNGSPTSEFKFFKGLKQGDPLSPFLFILIMESLHLSFNNVVNAGLFKGIHINDSLSLSHLFYADDAIFVGEWNLSIFLLSFMFLSGSTWPRVSRSTFIKVNLWVLESLKMLLLL
ncbi:RNA-directed DNA polymerase, eukaryota, partial [Tanacetum coccineum]